MKMPVDKGLDQTFNLLTEGYRFIQNRNDKLQSKVFETRVLGKKMVCMTGKDAVELFYNPEYFERHGAIPKRIQKTLFGEGGVQTLDGEAHVIRKNLFLSLMTPNELHRLYQITLHQWRVKASQWRNQQEIVLFDEAEDVLCRAACTWLGVPLDESESWNRAIDFGLMIDAIGGVGKRYREGRNARKRTEEWIRSVIEKYRSGAMEITELPIHTVSMHRDQNGKLLDLQIAAVECINLLRPIVAVARFIIFGALALYQFPQTKEKVKDELYLEMFIQEVRRYYPFAPFLGAKAIKNFDWNGFSFEKGTSVLIDLYGTNHDPESWEDPNEFIPERFGKREENAFDFIPQGGGDPKTGHRCPGEEATITIMKASLQYLVNELGYIVIPNQDVSIDLVRIPTIPKSRFRIRIVK